MTMIKVLVLIAIAAVVFGSCENEEFSNIPGVSTENLAKLRQLLTPRPANKEAFKQIIQQWEDNLPATEKAAAVAHREKMSHDQQEKP